MTERLISEQGPLDAALLPGVTPRAQYTGSPGMVTMRAMVGSREKGRWYISHEMAAVIADLLEGRGRVEAEEFRKASDAASCAAPTMRQGDDR
jgi:hypothetical protein